MVSELSASLLSISALEEQRASLEEQRASLEEQRATLEAQRGALEEQRSGLEAQCGVLEGERDGLTEQAKAQAEALQQARPCPIRRVEGALGLSDIWECRVVVGGLEVLTLWAVCVGGHGRCPSSWRPPRPLSRYTHTYHTHRHCSTSNRRVDGFVPRTASPTCP